VGSAALVRTPLVSVGPRIPFNRAKKPTRFRLGSARIALTLTAGLVELEMAEFETGEKASILATFTPEEKQLAGQIAGPASSRVWRSEGRYKIDADPVSANFCLRTSVPQRDYRPGFRDYERFCESGASIAFIPAMKGSTWTH